MTSAATAGESEQFANPGTSVRFGIEGMHCASCVGRVERALGQVEQVRDVSVNLATGQAQVTVNGETDWPALAGAVGNAGFALATETTDLNVLGMNCASCVGRVEKALTGVPGVQSAEANLATGKVRVRHVTGAAAVASLENAVRNAGYGVSNVSEDDAGAQERADTSEISSLRRSIGLAVAATLPIVVLAMGSHFIAPMQAWLNSILGRQNLYYLFFVLASVVQFGPGLRFYRTGWRPLVHGAPDMNTLVMIGASAAWGYSVVATFVPFVLPEGTAHVYYEASAMIITLILAGRYMEARSKSRTGEAVRRLLQLKATTARVLHNGQAVEVDLAQVQVGDVVVLRPGDKVPVDGEVVEGASRIDESMVTGEPAPVHKGEGAEVVGGTINTTGSLSFRATRVGSDTVLARIIRMVETAQGAKLPIQSLVDRVTAYFVPAVLAAAAITFIVWLLFGPAPALTLALVNAVAVLIIACPCAMGLATPTSIMVATGRAARMGVLLRRGEVLQNLRRVATVAFDKTGTLTQGRPELVEMTVANGFERNAVLQAVAAVEAHSEHPVGETLVRAFEGTHAVAHDFEATPGYGVSARVNGQTVAVGSERFMLRLGVDVSPLVSEAQHGSEMAGTPVYTAIDGRIAAVLTVADPVKPSARDAIKALHASGMHVVMVTGDNQPTADAIAGQLGIDEAIGSVLPGGKADVVKRLRENGPVAFVGDGINDAPALAQADAGVAIGAGTDIAIDSADIVLMAGDLRNVPNAIGLSTATMANIRQNLFWAFAYNTALIPLAAGVLYPAFGLLLSPIIAAAAMAFSSVFVLGNALRLSRFKPLTRHENTANA